MGTNTILLQSEVHKYAQKEGMLHKKKLPCKDGFEDMRRRTWPTVTSPVQEGLLLEKNRPNQLKAAKLQQNGANSANKHALSVLAWEGCVNKYSKVNGNKWCHGQSQ